jgi:hypothetical protein
VSQVRNGCAVGVGRGEIASFGWFKEPLGYCPHGLFGRNPLSSQRAIQAKLLVRRGASGLNLSQVLDLRLEAQRLDIIFEIGKYVLQNSVKKSGM